MSAQLQQAIINAHNAGDVAAAQRLGQLLKQQKQAAPQQAASPRSVPPHRRNQPKETDGALAFSVDQAQKMYGGAAELVGRAVKSPGIEQYGKNVQAQQDKDIAKGGYQSKYSTFEDSYKKGGISSALGWAAEGVAENAATTGASLVGALGVSAAAVYGAPAWLVAAAGGATALNNVVLNTGENVLEQKEKLGDFDTAYAAGAGIIAGALDTVGAGRAIPKDALKTMTVAQIKETLEKQGKGAAAKEFMKRMGVEGLTEQAQEGVSMGTTASLGGEYTPEEVRTRLTDAFLLGGATSGTMNVGIGTAKAAANLVRGNSKSIKNEGDVEAAASFAQRMANIANANGYDLKDIDKMSTKGARETVDKAHVQYTEELKQKFADLKSRVKVTDQDSLAEVEDKIMTAAAYREGRNKTKNTVGNQEMAALERLTGDTREGQEAMSILRQLNQLTEVHNDGYQGGVSQITDQFAPFGASVGYDKGAVATERLLRPLASGSAAITTGGSSLLAQAAAQGTGRLIDKVTGKRSKVANYVKENSGNQGIPGSNAASLRETNIAAQEAVAAQEEEARLRQEQYTEEERQANLRRVQQGAPPQQGSPEDIMRDATGLDRSGLAQVIRILKANPNTLPATIRAIEAYETSVATGGLLDFGLYRDINALVDQYPQLKNLMVRPRNAQSADQGQAQQQLSQKEQNYQRGIENNRAEAARIAEAVSQDKTIEVQHKAHLLATLKQMSLDLGINPVSSLKTMAKRLEEKGVPGPTVEKYLGQYLQRVMQQQGAKAERDAAQDDVDNINEKRVVPVPQGNAFMQEMFGVTDPSEGGNYIDLDSKEDLTGSTYQGGFVKIIDGKPLLETSDAPAAPADKDSGNKVKVNLFKQKAGWKWIDYDGPETIVSTHQGSKHHYSLSSEFETPVTLQTYPTQPSEPRLRPTSQGKVVLGNKIGSISVRGRVHPVYDQVTIIDKRTGKTKPERMKDADAAGFDTSKVLYHGTVAEWVDNTAYESFNNPNPTPGINRLGTWLDDSPKNYIFLDGRANDVVYPVYIKKGKAWDIERVVGTDLDPFNALEQLIAEDMDIELRFDGAIPPVSENNAKIDAWKQKLVDMGYTHINIKGTLVDSSSNGTDGKPRNFTIVLDPKNIRSVNAQFDPSRADSDELVASAMPGLTDGPALAFDTSPNVNAINDGSETFPKMKGKTEVAKFLEARALNKIGGTVRDIADPADRELIADDLVAEAIYEMNSQDEGSAMDWYDLTIEKMLSMMSLKYPEIATDVNAKTPMLVALSIMSQNMDVPTNLKIAEKAYEYFRDKGQFEVIGQGKSQAVMELNFKKANMLLNKLGSMEALADFLQTKFTVKELNPVLQNYLGEEGKVGGENVDTVVYGSAVFGPKVGNGFYTNLRGDFSPVTMDMWFMRTVGRLKGKLMEFDEKKFQNQLDRLKKALGRKRISKEQLIDKAFELIKLHEADYKKNRKLYDLKKGDPKRKVKSEATKAAFTIKGSLKNTIDSPTNGTERNHLRSLVQTAVTKFNQQTGLSIEPAAFQALIWYPEQDLYKKLGVPLKNVRKDFATSLKELLIKEGFNEQDLNAAIDRVQPRPKLGPGEVRQSTVVPEQGTARSANERPGRPLQREESAAEVNLSKAPGSGALTQPESPQVPFDFTVPTVGQIKDKLEDAKGAVQMVLGKPGTKFEKGLSTLEDYKQLAELMDITVEIASDPDTAKSFGLSKGGTGGTYQGTQEGTAGVARVLSDAIEGVSEAEFLHTLAHEIGHGLEGQTFSQEPRPMMRAPDNHPQGSKAKKASDLRRSSLRMRISDVLWQARTGTTTWSTEDNFNTAPLPTPAQSKTIKKEIDTLQDGTLVSFGARPELGSVKIRMSVEDYEDALINHFLDNDRNEYTDASRAFVFKRLKSRVDKKAVKKKYKSYQRYIKGDAEFIVDPVHFYLMNPQQMKADMPETFKFIQRHFNASNIPIEIHANPLVTIVAILMAGIMGGGEEEEENPGVLSPGPGLLTV